MEGVVLFTAPKVQITAMVLQQYTIKQTLLVTTTKYEKKYKFKDQFTAVVQSKTSCCYIGKKLS